jgi:hypothetical protein
MIESPNMGEGGLMPSNAGEKQERHLFDYLRFQRFCVQVIERDQEVRAPARRTGWASIVD